MTLYVRQGGVWKAATVYIRKSGAWLLATVSVRKSGSWQTVSASAITCAASPTSITQGYTGAGGLSGSSTVTPSGGTGPYTYAWSQVSGSGFISAASSSAATTNFQGDGLNYPTSYNAIFQCTVTDSVGATATALVAVEYDPE